MIKLEPGGAEFFKIVGVSYYKGTVSFQVNPDGATVNISYNGAYLFENVSYSDIEHDEDGTGGADPVAFISRTELLAWVELYTMPSLPIARPFKVISGASTNGKVVKGGRCIVQSLSAVNLSGNDCYLKLYDMADAPTVGTDMPIMTVYLPGIETVAALAGETDPTLIPGKPKIIQLPVSVLFYYGLGIGITSGAADDDTGAIGAGDVVLNIIYQ